MKFRHAWILIFIFIAGCAASGKKFTEIESSIESIPAEMGRVIFYRGNSLLGAAITSDLYMDDVIVGRSVRGSFFYVDSVPGDIEVSATTEAKKKLTFTLSSGETKYVKTSVGLGLVVGRIIPTLVSKEDAEKVLPNLAYIGE